LDGLRGEEGRVGWMLLAVPVGVFVWKVSFIHFSILLRPWRDDLTEYWGCVVYALRFCLCYMGI
jgi:hypothetical protein